VIVFELICAARHRFEGWFASGQEFDRQRLAGLLSCPVCSSGQVSKLPTAKLRRSAEEAARVPTGGATDEGGGGRRAAPQVAAAVAAFVDYVLQNTDDVGRAFPEAARRIHHELAPRRGIRGTATREETEALREEGIEVVPLPVLPPEEYQ
jgi:hypothetical protein